MTAGIARHFLQERVRYGNPAGEALAGELALLGAKRVGLMISRSMRADANAMSQLSAAIGDRLQVVVDALPPHSPISTVLSAAAEIAKHDCDLLVAAGGSSIIDAAKAVILCLNFDAGASAELERYRGFQGGDPSHWASSDRKPVRMVAVPSTLSAAEYTFFAGLTDDGNSVKGIYGHPLMMPVSVVLDPAMTLGVPLQIFLSTGLKAIDHAVERACAANADPMTLATCLEAMAQLCEALPLIHADPSALGPRSSAQFASWMSMAMLGMGVGTGASHAIGHTLGGTFAVPHGFTSCIMLPAVVGWTEDYCALAQLRMQKRLGSSLRLEEYLKKLVRDLGLPTRLREVGIEQSDFERIATITMHDPTLRASPRPIGDKADLIEILDRAW